MKSIFWWLKMNITLIKGLPPYIKKEPKLHYLWVLLPLVIAGGLYTGTHFLFHDLPKPLEDNQGSNSERFVELYARNKLIELNRIGPRLVGSEANEIDAINFLTKSVEDIKSQALDKYIIEYDVQISSFGSYIDDDMVDIYNDTLNFVVRFAAKDQTAEASLLLNSHFDTVPESSGAGDDGTMVAVMLELLRVLSSSSKTLKYPIIFLFNGAEENSMQGSHAFITQHKWAEDVKAFVNLDVAGIGGRELLFQSVPGHPWLVQHYYKSVLHPYASTIAEEVFQSNMVPSDTDFKIFRDYGKIPGLDLAQSYNGFVYHSGLDRFDAMKEFGSLQNTGDNVLALVKSLATSQELEDPNNYFQSRTEGQAVFFDFLGLFMIFYTENIGIAINISMVAVSLTAMVISIWSMCRSINVTAWYFMRKAFMILLVQLSTTILAMGVTILIGVIIDAANAPLFWFSQQWLIFGIYFCPYFFTMAIVPTFYLNWRESELPLRYGIQLFQHANCVILILFVIGMTSLSIRSAFAVTFAVVFYTLSTIINWAGRLQVRAFAWTIPTLLGQVIPFMFYSYLAQIIFTTFIPITGRSGCTDNSELLIAAFTIVIAFLSSGFLTPMFSILRKSKFVISSFMVVFVAFVIMLATNLAFPFTKEVAAQRHWIFHTERIFYGDQGNIINNDSGYVLLPLDRYSPTTIEDIISGHKYHRTGEDCDEMLVCGVPVYSSTFMPLSNYSYWVPASPPSIPEQYTPHIQLINKRYITNTLVHFDFEISGPAHLQVFFNPMDECKVVDWSVSDIFPSKKHIRQNTYFLHFRHGRRTKGFTFYLEFQIPEDYEGRFFDIVLIAHHNNYPIEYTDDFKDYLAIYPDWVTLTPIVSSYISMKF